MCSFKIPWDLVGSATSIINFLKTGWLIKKIMPSLRKHSEIKSFYS